MDGYTRVGCNVTGPRGFHVECDSQADAVVLLERLTQTQQSLEKAERELAVWKDQTSRVENRFQLETLRTSEYARQLDDVLSWLKSRYGCPHIPSAEGSCCRLYNSIKALRDRPVNDEQAVRLVETIAKALPTPNPAEPIDILKSNPACAVCGDTPSCGDGAWRVNMDERGAYWEHRCREAHPQVGYWPVPARDIPNPAEGR